MATAKQQPKKILYHEFFCGDNIGEADGFFEIVDGKLQLVECWSTNDAHWRGEYMTGLLSWAGVEMKDLPEKYQVEGEKLLCKNWGLDYEDEEDDDGKDQPATTELFCQEGSSDKVYIANLYRSPAGWGVFGEYGRRGGKIKKDEKTSGVSFESAKAVYDKLIAEKIKKGYQYANAPANKDDEDEDY
jgi:predicted DNA-binding WGR domain protein